MFLTEGMSGGGIAGVVIGVLAVFGVTAAVVVMLRNRDWDVRSLVPSRAPASSSTPMTSFANMSYNSGSGAVKSN